jgi:N-methylhydantoinase B
LSAPRAVVLQVLNSRVQAIVNELGENILRAAHSTLIKETWDLAALLTTPQGEIFACSKEIAAKRLGMNLAPGLRYRPDLAPGDIIVSNDPIGTGGLATHLPDLYFWKPIFSNDTLLCFALVFVHVSDVGGAVPGSISPASVEIYQEGLRIPPIHLFRDGELQGEIRDLILANSRVPQQLWGDITAVVGALNVVERRVHELIPEYPPADFLEGTAELLDIAEARARELIADMPNGRFTFTDYIDGLPNLDPIRMRLTLEIEGDTVTMDFTGSDPEVRAAYNLYSHSQDGHWGLTRAFTDYFQTLDPDVPWNSGLVRPIKVRAPKGTVVNPDGPVACGSRVATFFRVYYMVFGALGQAIPGAVPASGPAESAIMLIATYDPVTGGRRINVGQAMLGGGGARPAGDGFDGNEMVSGYLRNVPVEILEHELPVRFLEYGLAAGTGGAGRHRGGNGIRLMVQFLAPDTTVTIRGLQRHQFRSWGTNGGAAGERGTIIRNFETAREQALDSVTVLQFAAGETLRVTTAGGGGFGNPLERQPSTVENEVVEGLLGESQAAERYGVIVRSGAVDVEGTRVQRASMLTRPPRPLIDFGPERQAFEEIWSESVYDLLAQAAGRGDLGRRMAAREAAVLAIKRAIAAGKNTNGLELKELVLSGETATGPA